jgi:1,4-dihydroxy-6-naphthoate synthase
MFYALTHGLLDVEGLEITHVLDDIETLNQAAFEGTYEITAISFHAYAYLHDRYRIMPSGASFGDDYGPVIVARQGFGAADLAGKRVAVPGKLTTAALGLGLWARAHGVELETGLVPFDRILDVVRDGEYDAGVVIHEGQLTYEDEGLAQVDDLGVWWKKDTGLPLPLGCNALRRDLPQDLQHRLCTLLTQSIEYGLDHRAEALDYAIRYARGLEDDLERSDRFVGMYVNDWTRSYGEVGEQAVRTLLARGHEAGLIPAVEAELIRV